MRVGIDVQNGEPQPLSSAGPRPPVANGPRGFSEPVALPGQFDIFPGTAVLYRIDPEQNGADIL